MTEDKTQTQSAFCQGLSLVRKIILLIVAGFSAVAVGLMAVQNWEGHQQDLERSEFKRLEEQISKVLSDPATCACQFDDLRFVGREAITFPYASQEVKALHASCDSNALPIVETGAIARGSETFALSLSNLAMTENGRAYLGSFQVALKDPARPRLANMILVPLIIEVDPNLSVRDQKIISCRRLADQRTENFSN